MPADDSEQFDIDDARIVPVSRHVDRRGRGSLRGQLVMAPDWDSGDVNDAIARDFA